MPDVHFFHIPTSSIDKIRYVNNVCVFSRPREVKIRLLWLGKLYHYRNHLQLKEKVDGKEGLGEFFL